MLKKFLISILSIIIFFGVTIFFQANKYNFLDTNSFRQISFSIPFLKNSQEQKTKPYQPITRTFRLQNQSIGAIYVGHLRLFDPFWWQGWVFLSEAKGSITIPTDKDIMLVVSPEGSQHLECLAKLEQNYIDVVKLSNTNIKDRQIKYLSSLAGLKFISLYEGQITTNGLRDLSKIKSVEGLQLYINNLNDDGLKYVALMGNLRRLELPETIGDQGIAQIVSLKNLTYLNLSRTQITDKCFRFLSTLKSLKYLFLYSTNITGKGFSEFTNGISLKDIRLNNSTISDEGIISLGKLKSLSALSLFNTNISDRGLVGLQSLTFLSKLDLANTRITDEGLNYIAELSCLESLELPKNVTVNGLLKLKNLKKIKRLNIAGIKLSNRGLGVLNFFPSIEKLNLPIGITDNDLNVIKNIPCLKELYLQNSPITNNGLSNVSKLKSLQKLFLHNGSNNMKISSSGLACLKTLQSLESLWLWNLTLDNCRLRYLEELSQLKSLEIRQTQIHNDDLAVLGKLKHLKYLKFDSNTVSDKGIAYLTDLRELEELGIFGSPYLTDEGLNCLQNLRKLRYLQIRGCFTDNGLSQLEKLKSLEDIVIASPNTFSQSATKSLRMNLPALQKLHIVKIFNVQSPLKVGMDAPFFSFHTIDGAMIDLKKYQGQIVLLYFWATWCSPCVANTPKIKEFYDEAIRCRNFIMIGLSLDDQTYVIKEHIKKYKLTWPQVQLGVNSHIAADYGVDSVPQYFLIDKKGTIIAHTMGDIGCIKEILGTLMRKDFLLIDREKKKD